VGEYRSHPCASSVNGASCSQTPRSSNFRIFHLPEYCQEYQLHAWKIVVEYLQAMMEQIEMFKRQRIEDGVKVSEITHQMTYDW